MKEVVLECHQLTKSYQLSNSSQKVLDAIDVDFYKGESVAVIGSSGAGKSTLLNLLGGLDEATKGYVSLMGQRYDQLNDKQLSTLRNQSLGFVYQFHHLLSEFTALENVEMPLLIRGDKKEFAERKAMELLDKVGLAQRAHHRPSELSGGERQRVAIARALVAEPACVLMDEPTGNLDEETSDKIQTLIRELGETVSTSFVIVTHDKKVASSQDRILLLKDGKLNEVALNELA